MADGHPLVVVMIIWSIILKGESAPVGDETSTPGGTMERDGPSTNVNMDDIIDVDMDAAMAYLAQYKYIEDQDDKGSASRMASLHDPTEALKELQHMAGIKETGLLDNATKEVIKLPRCGVSDNSIGLNVKRRKRYTIEGSKWSGVNIRYRISQYSQDLSEKVIDYQIKRAFDMWASYTPLRFTKVGAYQPADIDIRFAFYSHGDPFPFDGIGKTLAHAFFPRFGGDVHLDDSDTFTSNRYGGIDLLQVVTHELGHSLGLSHSSVKSAIMAPFYRGYNPNVRLDTDDINGIQRIYGSNTGTTTRTTTRSTTSRTTSRHTTRTTRTTTTTPRPRGKPGTTRVTYNTRFTPTTTNPTPSIPSTPAGRTNMCHDVRFDAITQFEGKTWIFRGSEYAELNFDGIVNGFPQPISNKWQGLPSNLDAALHWPATYYWAVINGRYTRVITGAARTYFFKGDMIWRFDERSGLRYRYPRPIKEEFPGLPGDLDAAFVWSGNSRTYFIKGSYYYRVTRWRGVDPGYPKPLYIWGGIPSNVDAAFQWVNRRTYFFRGPHYYRFNDFRFNIDSGYPRLSSIWWLGCPDSSSNMISNLEMHEPSDQFEEIDTVPEDSSNDEVDKEGDSANTEKPDSKRKSPNGVGSIQCDNRGLLLCFILCLSMLVHIELLK